MEREAIRDLIVQVISAIQRNSGRPVPVFSDELRPLKDIEGFDSLNAEEAATMLSDRLGWEVPSDLFVGRKKLLRLAEVVDRLIKLGEYVGVEAHAGK